MPISQPKNLRHSLASDLASSSNALPLTSGAPILPTDVFASTQSSLDTGENDEREGASVITDGHFTASAMSSDGRRRQ